jgi:hypothetical protein
VIDNINEPLRLYYDNNPAVQYAHNNRSSGAAKHIYIKYYIVKDKVQDHIINFKHISTDKMLADPLTKGLPSNVFREHVASMGLREKAYDSRTYEGLGRKCHSKTEKCVVAVSLTVLIAVTMRQFNALICNGIG